MTQSNALALAGSVPDQNSVSAGPKLGFILRRYKWLMVIGTLLGVIVGGALFLTFRQFDPRWTAYSIFEVRPNLPNPLNSRQNNPYATDTGVSRFINSQVVLVTSPDVLQTALQTNAFQQSAKNPAEKSSWLLAHSSDPMDDLQKDLNVEPIPHTNLFKISLSWHNPIETANLVNAVSTVYMNYVRNQERTQLSREARSVSAAEANMQAKVEALQARVETYRVAHDVPGLIEQHTVLANTLATLTTFEIQAEIRAKEAQSAYEEIKKQVANNTLKLSPDMQQIVDNDTNLRELQLNLLDLKQSIQVSKKTLGTGYRGTIALEIREASLERQIDQLKEKLTVRARLQMQEAAKTRMQSAQAMRASTQRRVQQEQLLIHDLDAAVQEYDGLLANLKTNQMLLDHLIDRSTMMNLQRTIDESKVQLRNSAIPPKKMSFPKLSHFLIGGLVFGLLLAFGLAYLVEVTNTRVNTPRDVTGVMRLPLLGFIPEHADDPLLNGNPMMSVRLSPASMTAESFRQIRGRLAASASDRPIQTLLVASFSPGGGASTVASNLANSIAISEMKVLLVDANFYRPTLQSVYPFVPEVGLADVLAGRIRLDQAIAQCPDVPALHILSCGSRSKLPTELTDHRAFPDVLAQMKTQFDMIIFDGAPLTFVADSINLASRVDGVIAVLRAGMITRGTVGRIREQLRQVHANFVGIVLNAAQTYSAGYFRQHYRTFFEYAGGGKPGEKTLPGA
jgi:capsular exopolysaccharide synthesis family protein